MSLVVIRHDFTHYPGAAAFARSSSPPSLLASRSDASVFLFAGGRAALANGLGWGRGAGSGTASTTTATPRTATPRDARPLST